MWLPHFTKTSNSITTDQSAHAITEGYNRTPSKDSFRAQMVRNMNSSAERMTPNSNINYTPEVHTKQPWNFQSDKNINPIGPGP